jgi:glucosyl-3-phosphoglycerate synthase
MQLLVVDDGSEDGTGEVARRAGAEVIAAEGSWRGRAAGKGAAMTTGLQNSVSDIVVFLDADVTDLRSDTVALLTEPLLRNSSLVMTKATYDRALNGAPHEGGRVNALLARPLLRRCFPELGDLTQPLAGEYAVRREQLTGIRLEPGYGVEVGLLIDIASRYGADVIAEVDLATRTHRNRPLRELTGHADAIVAAILDRYSAGTAALRPTQDRLGSSRLREATA